MFTELPLNEEHTGTGADVSGHIALHNALPRNINDVALAITFVSPGRQGIVGNGVTDDTTAMQTLINASAATNKAVFLSAGTYLVSNLKLHGNMTIFGTGKGSVLKAKSGTTGQFLSLSSPSSDRAVVLTNIALDGSSTAGLHGIWLDNTGLANDSLHRLETLFISNFEGDGLHVGAAVIESNFRDMYIYNTGGYGVNIEVGATDNRFDTISVGLCSKSGFLFKGNSNHFISCKAFYCGFVRGGTTWTSGYHGFEGHPDANQQLRMVSIIGCEAQNNASDGFHIDGSATNTTCQHITLAGCMSDGNNEAGSTVGTVGDGFYFNRTLNSTINGCISNNQTPGSHYYGLALYGDCTGTTIGPNDFQGSSAAIGGTGTGYIVAATGNVFAGGVVISPAAALSGTQMGVDAPVFGSTPNLRLINQAALGNVQLVAPNGEMDVYAGGNNTFTVDSARARVLGKLNVVSGSAPASSTASGTQGDIAWDASYVYVCTATNTWKRTAIATF